MQFIYHGIDTCTFIDYKYITKLQINSFCFFFSFDKLTNWEYFMRIEDFVSFWAIFKCIILYQNLEFCIKNIVLCIKNRAKMSIKSIIFIFSISTTSNPISFTNYSTFISTTNHTTDRHITYYDVWSVEFVTRLYHWWRIDGAIDINVSLF